MKNLEQFEQEVSSWAEVSVHPHRFGGREFRFRAAEIGHIHTGGLIDIPFTRSVHDELLKNGLAEEHRWVPNSGWITFRIESTQDLGHALWLMRLSYLRYALKTASDPRTMFERESQQLHLNYHFKSLLGSFVPKRISAAPVPASQR